MLLLPYLKCRAPTGPRASESRTPLRPAPQRGWFRCASRALRLTQQLADYTGRDEIGQPQPHRHHQRQYHHYEGRLRRLPVRRKVDFGEFRPRLLDKTDRPIEVTFDTIHKRRLIQEI